MPVATNTRPLYHSDLNLIVATLYLWTDEMSGYFDSTSWGGDKAGDVAYGSLATDLGRS